MGGNEELKMQNEKWRIVDFNLFDLFDCQFTFFTFFTCLSITDNRQPTADSR